MSTAVALAPALLAVALLLAPGSAGSRGRLRQVLPRTADASAAVASNGPAAWWPWLGGLAAAAVVMALSRSPGGLLVATVAGLAAVLGCRRLLRAGREREIDPLLLAAAWDRLAACLRSGLPVAVAVRAVVSEVPGVAGAALRRVAELLALGADPVQAWDPALAVSATARLARSARQSARSGSAVADAASGTAAELRAGAADAVHARAQRAGVLIAGPLGLCFLPAFLALGVLPVVIGLAGPLLARW